MRTRGTRVLLTLAVGMALAGVRPGAAADAVASSPTSSGVSYMAGGYFLTAAALNDWRDVAGFPLGFQSTNIVHKGATSPV
ncbi:MAG: hypothetical protein ACRENS_11185, partial [Candidatus Eiseniibacteriota bacterium]